MITRIRKLFVCNNPGCIKRNGGMAYMWFARVERPLACPQCHSPKWIEEVVQQ
jgi:hypothetical protein